MTTPVRILSLSAESPLHERCDRCPARARLRAELTAGELMFCAHHAREHHARLLHIGARLSVLPP
jgi:hypothetical protein